MDSSFLEETLGKTNRHLNSLASEDVPMHKTMNYLPANKMFPGHL
jgi:hypothetical protein